jgi:quercetin dioxygenase-like cupin family protein
LLRHNEVQRYLWGDEQSGQIIDWYYRNSDKLIISMWSIPPGAGWRHSAEHKSFYDGDECYYILQGRLTFHNPLTGEVYIVNAGETLHFHGKTWHYGYNFETQQTLILTALAPLPPDLTAAGELAQAATPLESIRGGRYEFLGNWPWNAAEVAASKTIHVLRPDDWLYLIQGQKSPVRVAIFASTDKLTMGMFSLLPAVFADPETHPGDEVAFLIAGKACVFLPETRAVFDLHPRDAMCIPAGVPHQYFNESDQPATFVFATAPQYR